MPTAPPVVSATASMDSFCHCPGRANPLIQSAMRLVAAAVHRRSLQLPPRLHTSRNASTPTRIRQWRVKEAGRK